MVFPVYNNFKNTNFKFIKKNKKQRYNINKVQMHCVEFKSIQEIIFTFLIIIAEKYLILTKIKRKQNS